MKGLAVWNILSIIKTFLDIGQVSYPDVSLDLFQNNFGRGFQ